MVHTTLIMDLGTMMNHTFSSPWVTNSTKMVQAKYFILSQTREIGLDFIQGLTHVPTATANRHPRQTLFESCPPILEWAGIGRSWQLHAPPNIIPVVHLQKKS